MGWLFDYSFYCYKFFQNLLFLQAITFVIFCQFTQDYFMDILKKWTFACQSWFWQVTGVQYSIAILTIFCFFQKHEAIAHLAKPSLGIRVAIKVSIELVTFLAQIGILIPIMAQRWGDADSCEFATRNGKDYSDKEQDMDTVKRYFYVGIFTSIPYFFTVFIYLGLRDYLRRHPNLGKIYEYKYVRAR
jgi:hypothetical protein